MSDNTAANAVINTVGIENINHFFKKVGALNTQISREFMDHEALKNNNDNMTTAQDMCLFLDLLNNNDFLSLKSKKLLLKSMKNQQFKDKLPSYQNMFEEHVEIGNKTGTLSGLEHDIGFFSTESQTVFVTVLSSGWKFNHEGQQMIAQVGKKIQEYIS